MLIEVYVVRFLLCYSLTVQRFFIEGTSAQTLTYSLDFNYDANNSINKMIYLSTGAMVVVAMKELEDLSSWRMPVHVAWNIELTPKLGKESDTSTGIHW